MRTTNRNGKRSRRHTAQPPRDEPCWLCAHPTALAAVTVRLATGLAVNKVAQECFVSIARIQAHLAHPPVEASPVTPSVASVQAEPAPEPQPETLPVASGAWALRFGAEPEGPDKRAMTAQLRELFRASRGDRTWRSQMVQAIQEELLSSGEGYEDG